MSSFNGLADRHFSEFWFECPALADGTRVLLRPLGPADQPLLRASGLDDLRHIFTAAGEDRLALGAFGSNPRALVGIGGFVRSWPAEVAELSLSVADRFQRRGLGALLLARLRLIALERGVTRFTGDVREGNRPMLDLLRKLDARLGLPSLGVRSVELSLS
jgi:GNAT superfamily N-acetyltransferase